MQRNVCVVHCVCAFPHAVWIELFCWLSRGRKIAEQMYSFLHYISSLADAYTK